MSTVTGYEQAIETLRGIDVAMRGKIVRNALSAYVSSAAAQMKTDAPQRRDQRTGIKTQRLRTQLGSRIVAYRDGAIVTGFAGERSYRRGQRHAHLLEDGHRIVTGGTVSQIRYKKNKITGEITGRSYTPRARKADRRGAGKVLGMTEARPFMRAIISRYVIEAPEKLRVALADAITAHVAGASRG